MKRQMGALLLAAVMGVGCGSGPQNAGTPGTGSLTGEVKIDGSSTLYPVTEAVAEEFQGANPGVRVTVGIAGTGGGFKRFLAGETDINDASRPIIQAESDEAAAKSLQYLELPVAYDGLSIVVNPRNDFVTSLTVAELKKIWEPGSKVKMWSDVRPAWPKREMRLFGAGTDSGTFDYFTEAINGKAKAIRPDYSMSEDDNVLVQGIAGDPDALGFFGFAYFAENRDKLKLVAVDNGQGPVLPSQETISGGTYTPLSRPLFIYVASKAVERPAVKAFVDFYMANAAKLAEEVGFIRLPEAIATLAGARWAERRPGSVFHGHAMENSLDLQALMTAAK